MISKGVKDELILVERYHDGALNQHNYRILKAKPPAEELVDLSSWSKDKYHFGEGGFLPISDKTFLFAKYPHIYIHSLGEGSKIWLSWEKEHKISRIIQVDNKTFLAKSDDSAWLVDLNGHIIKSWLNLREKNLGNLPFMGNRIFDLSLNKDGVWLSYWGARRLDLIGENKRKTIAIFKDSFLPHAISTGEEESFILASKINPGSTDNIVPLLYRIEEKNDPNMG